MGKAGLKTLALWALLPLLGCSSWYTIKEIPEAERLRVIPGESWVKVWGPVPGLPKPATENQPTLEGTAKAFSYPVLVVEPDSNEDEEALPVTVILLESGKVEAEIKASDPAATAAAVSVGTVAGASLILAFLYLVSSLGSSGFGD